MRTQHELVGRRVFYTENGAEDTGTVLSVSIQGRHKWLAIRVKWDNGDPTDEYTVGQLTFI